MKKTSFLASFLLTAVFVLSAALCSAQDSIAYQLVIRNSAGELVTNKQVNMRFALLKGDSVCYQETMPTKTDKYGNISVMVGTGKATKGAMKDVPWSTMDISLKVETDVNGGENFAVLGTVPFAASPYAMYAATAGSNANNGAPKDGEALFEVCDRDGKPVFAVYNDGIVVYVDENGNKAKRSGFVVTGRNVTKDGEAADYFAVDAEGTHVFVDDAEDSGKAPRSGFVVTGRKVAKSATTDSEPLADNRTATKAAGADMFSVNGSLTTVYVNDAESSDKAKRSGFVITGRKVAKDGKNMVDINGSRTNLNTTTLSVANSNSNVSANPGDEEAPAPVAALQLSKENVTMNSDMSLDGGVRPALDVEQNEEYNVYLSDNEEDEDNNLDDFDEINVWGVFRFYPSTEDYYNWLASFHDTLVVPLTSSESVLLLNSKGEETAIIKDAYVMVNYDSYWNEVNVWPLRALEEFKVSFALTYYTPTTYSGKADKYARFNVTINSKAAYPGCRFYVGGKQAYSAIVETSQGSFNLETSGGNDIWDNYEEFEAVYGETVTLAVTEVPAGQVFDSWRCNDRRYIDSVLRLPIKQIYTDFYPVFKDTSSVLYVDGSLEYEEGENGDGSQAKPFTTIADALASITAEEAGANLRGFRIDVKNATSEEIEILQTGQNQLSSYAKYITIDFESYIDAAAYTKKILVTDNLPVIVKNARIKPNATSGYAVSVTASNGLTLDNCTIVGMGSNANMGIQGAHITSGGKLVLTKSTISGFKAFDSHSGVMGGGAYVGDGSTLVLKNASSITGNTAKIGGGVYVASGATLNISNSGITQNSLLTSDGAAGEDVYVENNSTFIINSWNTEDEMTPYVALADGAFVTMKATGGRDEGRLSPINFSKVANPKKKVVLFDGELSEMAMQHLQNSETFIITDKNLLDNDYSKYLLFKDNTGYPHITSKIYSVGKIDFTQNNNQTATVDYAYYRDDSLNQYLHLKFIYDGIASANDHSYNREYRNYWFVGGGTFCTDTTLFCDTTYLGIGNEAPVSGYSLYDDEYYENYTPQKNNGKPLTMEQIPENYTVDDEGNILDGNGNNVMKRKKNIVTKCNNLALLKNQLPLFANLINSAKKDNGNGNAIMNFVDNATGILWIEGYTLFGDDVLTSKICEKQNLYSGGDYYTESQMFGYIHDYRRQTMEEVEEYFDKLRNGFDVTIAALGGTVTCGGKTFTNTIDTVKVMYDTDLSLTAIGDNFMGWSDGFSNATHNFTIRGDLEIIPIFKQSEFTVSANAPYNSISMVGKVLENSFYTAGDIVTIKVKGTVKGTQTLSDKINVGSITIEGESGNNTNNILNGNMMDRVLTISTATPITIKNLTIKNGYATYGGGIYCAPGSNVTLADGTRITKNTATHQGGGVYVDGEVVGEGSDARTISGKLTMTGTAIISANKITYDNDENGGLGVYVNYGEFTMDGGEISNHKSTEINVRGALRTMNSTFTMNGGKITRNTTIHIGANIMSKGSVYNINGGEISYGYVTGWGDASAAAMWLENDIVNMTSGEIFGNVVKPSGGVGNGGAIFMDGSDGKVTVFNMTGGTIHDNYVDLTESTTACGGAFCIFKGVLNLSENAYIPYGANINGTVKTGVGMNDVYYCNNPTNVKITIGGPLNKANVASITMEDYSTETQVLQLATDGNNNPITSTRLALEYTRFSITPQNTSDGPKPWYLWENGKIAALSIEIKEENDAEHPFVLSYDPNFKKEGVAAGFPEVYVGDVVTDNNRDYYLTMRGYHRISPQYNGAFQLFNKNPNTTFTFHITIEGDNNKIERYDDGYVSRAFEIKGDGQGSGGNVKLIFDTKTGESGTLTLNGGPDFEIYDNVNVTYELADGCSFSGTADGTTFTDINAFFEQLLKTDEHTSGCSFTISKE